MTLLQVVRISIFPWNRWCLTKGSKNIVFILYYVTFDLNADNAWINAYPPALAPTFYYHQNQWDVATIGFEILYQCSTVYHKASWRNFNLPPTSNPFELEEPNNDSPTTTYACFCPYAQSITFSTPNECPTTLDPPSHTRVQIVPTIDLCTNLLMCSSGTAYAPPSSDFNSIPVIHTSIRSVGHDQRILLWSPSSHNVKIVSTQKNWLFPQAYSNHVLAMTSLPTMSYSAIDATSVDFQNLDFQNLNRD